VSRSFFFGTNTKMHQTPAETLAFLDGLAALLPSGPTQLFVLPSFTSLPDAARHPVRRHIWLGAQNVHWEDQGAHTGEVSAPMLAALGLDLVMVGHAERRAAGETDATIAGKVRAALRHGLRVLLCVGETRDERAAGVGEEVALRQVMLALHGFEPEQMERVIVAYEPVWSIGEDGTPATPEEAWPVAMAIKRRLTEENGRGAAVLYGGSVNAENAAAFARARAFDGLFVGRAAWTPEGFAEVLRIAERVRCAE
jgi:triosephosphate isomerase